MASDGWKVSRRARTDKDVTGKGGKNVNMHAIERKMAVDAGIYKTRQQKVTIDSLLSDARRNRAKLNLGPRGGRRSNKSEHNGSAESSFMSSALKRLKLVEQRNAVLKEQMSSLAQEVLMLSVLFPLTPWQNHILQNKLKAHEKIGDAKQAATELYNLKTLLAGYQRQCSAMEDFLADYGLVWCGYRAGESSSSPNSGPGSPTAAAAAAAAETGTNMNEPSSPTAKSVGVYFKMSKMTDAVKDLNSLANEGEMDIRREGGMARFTGRTEVLLVFYKDGMFFRNGPLRPYSLKQTQVFIDDMLQGYFPSELKDQFPEGVIFKLHDKSSEDYEREAHIKSFAKGMAGYESAQHLLQRLPKSVIQDGKVIQVREGISKLLGQSNKAASEMQEGSDGRSKSTTNVDTIAAVRKYVAKSLDPGAKFELRTNYPRRSYENDNETLEAAKLVPNAALNVRVFSS
eukprot:jgi/Bigna1/66981/fgenesh1_pg.2_\